MRKLAFDFEAFFRGLKEMQDRPVNQPVLATWLLDFDSYYSVLGEGGGVNGSQIGHWLSKKDPLGGVVNRVAEFPVKKLVAYIKKGINGAYPTKDPAIVVKFFSDKISQDGQLPKSVKEKLLQYADKDTLAEFLSSLFFFSVTERVPQIPDVLEPNLPSCLPQRLWLNRKDSEAELQKLLETGAKEIFITGEGGLGKTEFIVNYISRKFAPYRFYFTAFKGSMRDTVMQLSFNDWSAETIDPETGRSATKPVAQQYAEKMQMLKELPPKAVLVIDNLEVGDQPLWADPCLQELEKMNLRLIFTTRMPMEDRNHIQLSRFSTGELLKLMRAHLGSLFADKELINLIEQVEHHTLLVDLIARLLANSLTGVTPEEISGALDEQWLVQLDEKVYSDYNRAGQEKTVLNHLLTLFDVSNLSQDACFVLSCAALLPVDGIGSKLFLRCLGTERKWLTVVRDLRKSGWITVNRQSGKLTVHSLIRQACVQCSTTKPGWEYNGGFLERIVREAYYPQSYPLAQQLQAVLTQACKTIGPDEEGVWHTNMYNMIGHLYGTMGDFEGARQFAEMALILSGDMPANHPSVLSAKTMKAIAERKLGMYSQAYELFLEVLHQKEYLVQAGESLYLGTDYHNLAGALMQLGRHEEGLHYQLKALDAAESYSQITSIQLSRIYRRLSQICGLVGDHTKQLEYALRAVLKDENAPLERGRNYGAVCSALADARRYAEALNYANMQLEVCQKNLPSKHLQLAYARRQLADVLAGLGRLDEACAENQEAITLFQELLPEFHPALGRTHYALGIVVQKKGQYDKAKESFLRAQACFENTYSGDHMWKQKCQAALDEVERWSKR